MRPPGSTPWFLLAALALGCGHPAVEGAPKALVELRAASTAYNRASDEKSADRIVSFFAPQVVSMSPQGPRPVEGVEPNRAAWQRFFSGKNPAHSMTTDTVAVSRSGDLGYTMGDWQVGIDTPNGRASATGRYLAVWRVIEGQWRIVVVSAFTNR
jgi:ketosteroid isomerase-like protein